MILYICNVLSPLDIPEIQLSVNQLVWLKHGFLINKITGVFPSVKHEYHHIYKSLLEKLGVHIDIKYEQPPTQPTPPVSSSNVTESGSNSVS